MGMKRIFSVIPGDPCPITDDYTFKLIHLNFHPLEFGSRYREPQLQVCEKYS